MITKIQKKALVAISIKIFGLALSFILQIILARLLSASEFGNYMLVMSWVLMLTTITMFGMGDGIIKYTSKYLVEKNFQLLDLFSKYRNKLLLLTTSIVLIIISIYAIFIDNGNIINLILLSVLIIIFTIYQVYFSLMRALGYAILAINFNSIIRPLIFLFFIALLYSLDFFKNSYIALMIQIFVLLVILMYFIFKTSSFIPDYNSNSSIIGLKLEWQKYALSLFIISLANELMRRSDTLMLGYYETNETVGLYSAAVSFSMLLLFGLQAINSFGAQIISSLYTENKLIELQNKLDSLSKLNFLITIPIFIIFIFFGKELLYLYGNDFIKVYDILLILSLAQLINSLVGPVGYVMSMTGHQKQASYIFLSGAILNIILNIILIPQFGMLGAACATLFAISFWNITLLIYIKKQIGISTIFIRI